MEISSGAIFQSSLDTRVTAAPERLEKSKKADIKDERWWFKIALKATLPCPASAPHTMDVLFDVSGEIVVEDVCYIEDVQPPRCQICGDKDPNST